MKQLEAAKRLNAAVGEKTTKAERRAKRSLPVFTLVELLIVVAVMAILTSLLLPALNQSRASGRRIACMNNVRQLGAVSHLYIGDWNGFLPPCTYGGTSNWYCNAPGLLNPLWSYVGNKVSDNRKTIFECPSNPLRDAYRSYPGYLANSDFFRPATSGRSVNGISCASKCMILVDGPGSRYSDAFSSLPISFNKDYVYFQPWPFEDPILSTDLIGKNAHKAGTNCLFLDAHAEWLALRDHVAAMANMAFWPGDGRFY